MSLIVFIIQNVKMSPLTVKSNFILYSSCTNTIILRPLFHILDNLRPKSGKKYNPDFETSTAQPSLSLSQIRLRKIILKNKHKKNRSSQTNVNEIFCDEISDITQPPPPPIESSQPSISTPFHFSTPQFLSHHIITLPSSFDNWTPPAVTYGRNSVIILVVLERSPSRLVSLNRIEEADSVTRFFFFFFRELVYSCEAVI